MNVSSVKNLNGETFSAVQDTALTDVVQTNSGVWNDVSVYQTNSATYLTEPNLEYNAVNEISGYNGSAISQYGAEKQWLQHDDTIVHVANSAQYAFGVNVSALQRLMGIDETVLWSGTPGTNSTGVLTEPVWNFNRFKMHINSLQGGDYVCEFSPTGAGTLRSYLTCGPRGNNDCSLDICKWNFTENGFSAVSAKSFHSSWTATAMTVENNQAVAKGYVSKIVGIGRKA